MQRRGSKESQVYHDSVDDLSYGSDPLDSNGNVDTSFRSHPGPIISHYGAVTSPTPKEQMPYRHLGPQNKRSLRNFERSQRSMRILQSPPPVGARRMKVTELEPLAGSISLENAAMIEKPTTGEVLWEMIFGNKMNILLLAMPFAIASHNLGWSSMSIFICNFIAMVPLAALLGAFTEEVAAHTNETIGGLINATFGNAVEVVVAVQALLAGEIRVVQASMIGSIFSNLLLVLGCCFFFGGLIHKEQQYQSMVATANMGLLALSSIALVLPTPFAQYYEVDQEEVLFISRIVAVFLILMYLQLLIFQLKTHTELFDDGDDGEEIQMPFYVAIGGLVGITLIITQFSDYLVQSIDGFCSESGISRSFVGLIILPIVGNAVEHATAVSVAMKDKMDLAMGVAVGSSTQISLFVTPLTVIVGWYVDRPMTLNFPQFEVILFILSVIVVSICVSNSKSNWLEGSMLITTYVMIAVGFWFEKVVDYR